MCLEYTLRLHSTPGDGNLTVASAFNGPSRSPGTPLIPSPLGFSVHFPLWSSTRGSSSRPALRFLELLCPCLSLKGWLHDFHKWPLTNDKCLWEKWSSASWPWDEVVLRHDPHFRAQASSPSMRLCLSQHPFLPCSPYPNSHEEPLSSLLWGAHPSWITWHRSSTQDLLQGNPH